MASISSFINKEAEFNGWRVIVQQAPSAFAVRLYILKVEHGKVYIGKIKDNHLEMEEIKEGAEGFNDFAFECPRPVWDTLAMCITGTVENIDKKEIDAQLKATQYHLEDMRKLVFNKK